MNAITFESVTKVFWGRRGLFSRAAAEPSFTLRELSVQVSSGSVLAVLGPNGSGKTTLLRLISTMLLPDHGRVLVHGADTRRHAQQVRTKVGFAISNERSFFPRLTARENLEFFAALDNVLIKTRSHRTQTVLDRTLLLEASDTLVMNFSSGMCRKLALARALMKQPSVLLLDEPTRSLDAAAASEIRKLVREVSSTGTTVVIATHNLEEASAVADSVLVLERGRVVSAGDLRHAAAADVRFAYPDAMAGVDVNDAICAIENCP